MICLLTKVIMKKTTATDEIRELLLSLPEPAEYFAGHDGWFAEPPRNILVFARRSPGEAMDALQKVVRSFHAGPAAGPTTAWLMLFLGGLATEAGHSAGRRGWHPPESGAPEPGRKALPRRGEFK